MSLPGLDDGGVRGPGGGRPRRPDGRGFSDIAAPEMCLQSSSLQVSLALWVEWPVNDLFSEIRIGLIRPLGYSNTQIYSNVVTKP